MSYLPPFLAVFAAFWLSGVITHSTRWRLYRTITATTAQFGWLAALLISVAISALSYVIMPKPKAAKPAAAKELDSPVAEAGKPIAVVLGTITCSELNILWTGDKTIRTYEVDPE